MAAHAGKQDGHSRWVGLIEREKIRVFYACIPARFGIINPDRKDVA
jgi:hypothetical protein